MGPHSRGSLYRGPATRQKDNSSTIIHQILLESIQFTVTMDSSMTSNLLNRKFRPIVEAHRHQTSETMNVSKPIQFKNVRHQNEAKELATRFLFECGVKLKTKSVTSGVAAQIYHRFYEAASEANYDPYLIAATCLYIASKQQDEPLKIRDLINVAHRTLNRDSDVLDLSEEYWNYRDSIVQAELLTMRMISFKTTSPDIHLYLLMYLRTLESWIAPSVWEKGSLVKLCWTFLQDFHHSKAIIQYEPQLIALAIIYFGLQIYGISVPCTSESDLIPWHEVLYEGAKKDHMWDIMEQLMMIYEKDKELMQ